MTVWPLYVAASAATIGFAALSLPRDRHDRQIAAWALFACCLAYNLAHWHRSSIMYPVMDVALGYLFLTLYMNNPKGWKLHLFGICLLMAVAHVTYQSALLFNLQIGYAYRTVLNALFVCQLWIVSKDGMKRGINRCRDMLGGIGVLRVYGFSRSKADS
jgi:hypothetical protein